MTLQPLSKALGNGCACGRAKSAQSERAGLPTRGVVKPMVMEQWCSECVLPPKPRADRDQLRERLARAPRLGPRLFSLLDVFSERCRARATKSLNCGASATP